MSGYYAHYFGAGERTNLGSDRADLGNPNTVPSSIANDATLAQQQKPKARIYKHYKERSPFLASVYNAATLWSQDKDGNSNSFPLEVIAAALRPPGEVTTRKQAIQVLKETGYVPSIVEGNFKTQVATIGWIGKKFRVNLKDQPWVRDFNVGQVVTALSIEDYLHHIDQFAAEYTQPINFLQAKPK